MSPYFVNKLLARTGFPRVSGDEPPPIMTTIGSLLFSPRERG